MRNGAAQDHGVQLAIGVDIVAEGASATQESEILDPFNGLADHRFAQIHNVSPVPSVKRRQLVGAIKAIRVLPWRPKRYAAE